VEDGVPARQTVLETLYYSSQAEARTEHTSTLVVQAEDSFTDGDWDRRYDQSDIIESDTPLSYSGRFPQKYTTTQRVRQWSPVSLRSLSLEPSGVTVPTIDWNDASLVTTREGNDRLHKALQNESLRSRKLHAAVVYHSGAAKTVTAYSDQSNSLLLQIPTMNSSKQDIFRLVCQLAPEGAGSLEDLTFGDPSDPQQWALVIMLQDGDDFHVFRKFYVVKESP
jgi:hypothetical protein